MDQEKRFLGEGKSRTFASQAKPGEILIEEGRRVYAVDAANFFCNACDGCGCRSCHWTGEQAKRRKKAN